MARRVWAVWLLLLCAGCKREAETRAAAPAGSQPVEAPQSATGVPSANAVRADAGQAGTRAKPLHPKTPAAPEVEETLEGHFRGKQQSSRVLFLADKTIVHSWTENGTEKREPVTTEYPAGERECKALRSLGSQDFLLCMYWFTGPGGGRVDGVLFDLKRRILGEFFSAAINIGLPSTLCFPDTAVGPMPSFNMVAWETKPATASADAEVRVSVEREGWSTQEAEALRALPAAKAYCECAGSEDCPGVPTPPRASRTVVYRLTKDQLLPSDESKQVLEEIAGQWGHSSLLAAWNLKMRGF